MNFSNLVQDILKEQFAGEFGMQDTSITPNAAIEVAKILDPTGILSWKDAYEAYQAFVKEQTPLNGLILGIAIGSIIPAGKYATTPAKVALKAGKTVEAARLFNNGTAAIKKILYSDAKIFKTHGMDTRVLQQALDVSEQNINNLVKELQQKFPQQVLPKLSRFAGTVIQRWKYPGLRGPILQTTKDISYYTEQYISGIQKVFGNRKFNPTDIEVLDYTIISGPRQVAELKDKVTGTKFLMYSSSGKGAPGVKAPGDWQTIPGFGDVDKRLWGEEGITKNYFIKDDSTVRLTKGSNQFLTGLARYLEKYGLNSLNK